MALWRLNDLPGAVAPYSPNRLLLGGTPLGSGTPPLIVSEDTREDALKFFNQFSWERTSTWDNLTATYAKEMAKYAKTYPPTQFELGDRIWSEDKNVTKVERTWTGRYEKIEAVGGNAYRIATSGRRHILGIERLKRAFHLLNGSKLKVDHHAPRPAPNQDDTWVVEDVVDHNKIPSTTKKGKQVIKWLVKWWQHDEWTWETQHQFPHNVCDQWRDYCTRNKVEIHIRSSPTRTRPCSEGFMLHYGPSVLWP